MSVDGKASKHSYTIEQRLRLHRRIKRSSGCWIWTGALGDSGYGRLALNRKLHYVHRLSYETFVGPIPDGLQIDHLCRNRACFAPSHLEPVTCRVNVLRGESPGARSRRRTHCGKGHDFAEHGVERNGRRICRTCKIEYLRGYRVTPRDPSVDRRRKASAA